MRLILLYDKNYSNKNLYKKYFKTVNDKINYYFCNDKQRYSYESKNVFIQKCMLLDIHVPKTEINSPQNLNSYIFPVICKGINGDTGTQNKKINCYNDLLQHISSIIYEYQIQEYLEDYTFHNIQFKLNRKHKSIELISVTDKIEFKRNLLGNNINQNNELIQKAETTILPFVKIVYDEFINLNLEDTKIINFDFAKDKNDKILFIEGNIRCGGSFFLSDIYNYCSPNNGCFIYDIKINLDKYKDIFMKKYKISIENSNWGDVNQNLVYVIVEKEELFNKIKNDILNDLKNKNYMHGYNFLL
jgi:hypothetical protein